jgi:predicted ArsR family transcriptional regulator
LEKGELCVCQVTLALDLAPATISKHLAALKTAGLLQQRRDGKWIYYRLAERELNPYAHNFLALLRAALQQDPTVGEDLRRLAKINRVPVQRLCDRGRAVIETTAPAAEATSCTRVSP